MDSSAEEPTAAALSLCDACFGLTSSATNLKRMAESNGLQFDRTLKYLEEKRNVCKMCAWVLDVSDPTLWSVPGDNLEISIRSQQTKGETGNDSSTFDSIAIDTFGMGAPGTDETRGWVSFPIVAFPGMLSSESRCLEASLLTGAQVILQQGIYSTGPRSLITKAKRVRYW